MIDRQDDASSVTDRTRAPGVVRCRVRLWFGDHPVADYAASPELARRYTDAIQRQFQGLRVTIDPAVAERLRPLPCERLWMLAP